MLRKKDEESDLVYQYVKIFKEVRSDGSPNTLEEGPRLPIGLQVTTAPSTVAQADGLAVTLSS